MSIQDILIKTYASLSHRLTLIEDELRKAEQALAESSVSATTAAVAVNSPNSHISDHCIVEPGTIVKVHVIGETWGVGRAIAKYAYMEDPTIPFITAGIEHFNVQKAIIKIKHAQPISLLLKAVANLKADLVVIKM